MLMSGSPETDSTTLAIVQASNSTAQTIQQKDTTWTKLFVGGLPYHTTDKSLRDHFSVYGEIEEAVVITDRQTNKSRGYGFVIMCDRASAECACKDPNPIIDGRKANVNLAILGAKPRTSITSFPFATSSGLRTGYSAIPSQFGVPPSYIYGSPYIGAAASAAAAAHTSVAAAGLVPIQATQLSHAAAIAAATNHFYEYQSALAAAATAPYPNQYAAGFENYAYNGAAAAAGYITPYAYSLPPAGTVASATGAYAAINPYPQTGNASLQEARLQ